MDSTQKILLHATHGQQREERSHPGYRWDSVKRGGGPFVILQYTLKGTGIFENPAGTFPVGPGKALLTLVPEDAAYYYPKGSREPWVFSWLNFEGELSMSLWGALRDEFGPVLDIHPQSSCAWAFSHLVEMAGRRSFKSRIEESEMCYHLLLLCREQQQKRATQGGSSIREVMEYYRQRGRESFAVKEMAARTGMTREHFTRKFQKETGMSPAAYLRDIRITRAAALLQRTDMSVSAIAESCGFASGRQFSKTFRRFRGLSPMEFRLTPSG